MVNRLRDHVKGVFTDNVLCGRCAADRKPQLEEICQQELFLFVLDSISKDNRIRQLIKNGQTYRNSISIIPGEVVGSSDQCV